MAEPHHLYSVKILLPNDKYFVKLFDQNGMHYRYISVDYRISLRIDWYKNIKAKIYSFSAM